MDQDGNLIFENYPNINHILFNNIAQEIAQNIIPVNKYKQIVKSDVWRKLYNSNPTNVFARSASQHTEEQKAILSINQMYSKIYEHPECPSDEIVNDDDMFDGWMIHQKKEREAQKTKKDVSSLIGEKQRNAEELYPMAPTEDSAKKIDSMNTREAQLKRRLRDNKIKKMGQVSESNLPDKRQQIQMQANREWAQQVR